MGVDISLFIEASIGLSVLGDPDTKIHSPGADIMAFDAGGVEAMRLTESGGGTQALFTQSLASTPALRINAASTSFNDNCFEVYDSGGTLKTRIDNGGAQFWDLGSSRSISYGTPSDQVGIRFINTQGQIELMKRFASLIMGNMSERVVSADVSSGMKFGVFNTLAAQQAHIADVPTAGSATAADNAAAINAILAAIRNYGFLATS